MVQAHANQLLNQKESQNGSSGADSSQKPLYAATDRLASALERLERNLQHSMNAAAADPQMAVQLDAFSQENQALREERANLDGAIVQLQDQYNDLHQVASTIYNKLDDSIRRLTQIMEN